MTRKAATEAFQQGKLIAIGEYRGGMAATVPYKTKQGAPAEFHKASHNVEVGGMPVLVSEKLADAAAVASWRQPFKKGQAVAWLIDEYGKTQGSAQGSGTVVALDD